MNNIASAETPESARTNKARKSRRSRAAVANKANGAHRTPAITVNLITNAGAKPVVKTWSRGKKGPQKKGGGQLYDGTISTLNLSLEEFADRAMTAEINQFFICATKQFKDNTRCMSIAEKEGLFVLEDAAQGFGGVYKGRPAGSLAHAAATSFFPAKPLGCYGDGGAIFTDDEELAGIMESIRVHGQGGQKYDNVRVGLNGRFDTLQAAILIPKLEAFPAELVARQKIADQYTDLLRAVPEKVTTPAVSEGLRSAWAQYSLICKDRDSLQEALNAAGIPTMIYYPIPLHLQTAYSTLGYKNGAFPGAENASRNILSLPMHPYLSTEVVETIAKVIIDS